VDVASAGTLVLTCRLDHAGRILLAQVALFFAGGLLLARLTRHTQFY
jgi:hypothetical protein